MADKPINQQFDESDLCAQHCLFIAEYFRNNFNQRQAYKKVYGEQLSDEVADVNASRLLGIAKVAEVVKRKKEEIVSTAMIDAKWALSKRMEIIERCMTATPVMIFDKAAGKNVESGDYTFDATGANSALTAVEKHHLGMAENRNVQVANKEGESLKIAVTSDIIKDTIKDLKDEF